jgi:predicted TPR repeat methyltransferase
MNNKMKEDNEKINRLRDVIKKNPTRFKAMSILSHLLIDYSKSISASNDNEIEYKEQIENEAYEVAKKCIEVSPNLSIGYGALSIASPTLEGRMEALKRAIELEEAKTSSPSSSSLIISTSTSASTSPSSKRAVVNTDVTSAVGLSYALLRMLVEPRDEEQRRTTMSKGSIKHPSKRDLNNDEKKLYKKILDTLRNADDMLHSFQKQDDSINDCNKNKNNDNDKGASNNDMKNQSVASSQCKKNLGLAHYRLGMLFRKLIPESIHRQSSLFHYKECFKFFPPNDTITKKCRFWLATLGEFGAFGDTNVVSGDDNLDIDTCTRTDIIVNVDRCPEEYIVSLYSSFASKFDNLLVNKLKYETPTKLRKVVDQVVARYGQNREKDKDLLDIPKDNIKIGADLGCGTGLSGLAFQDYVNELYGIDLSPQMIDKASARKCYKQLFVGDLENIFKVLDIQQYDLIIACDVFVYIGELRCIFESVYKKLCPKKKGLFAFSTECLEESLSTNPYLLHKCARFSHKRSYIEMLAKEVGFNIELLEKSVIRQNQGKDVAGLLIVLSRN